MQIESSHRRSVSIGTKVSPPPLAQGRLQRLRSVNSGENLTSSWTEGLPKPILPSLQRSRRSEPS